MKVVDEILADDSGSYSTLEYMLAAKVKKLRELLGDLQCSCLPYAKPYDGVCENCHALHELNKEDN